MMATITSADGAIKARATREEDLDFVLASEHAARDAGYIGGWTLAEHRDALVSDDTLHLVLEAAEDGRRAGYVILRGLKNASGNLELKRITMAETGQGFGRTALRLVKAYAFEYLKAHRLWLDVFEHNVRARHLYTSEGFVVEGLLRECVRFGEGYASLVMMSLLEQEYWAQAGSPR
jgi:diamine N-acetyltransferase